MKVLAATMTACAAMAALVAGCAYKPPATQASDGGDVTHLTAMAVPEDDHPKDAAQAVPVVIFLDVYRVSVPVGSVSRDEEFWKRVDEHAVDVASYDGLYKNGVRVGVADNREWDFFKQVMEKNPGLTQRSKFIGSEKKGIELQMRKEQVTQDIFYFDRSNVLCGRTFDHCENFFGLAFGPVPRRAGDVRITLCPTVRSTRQRIEYTPREDEMSIAFVYPERIFDVNLKADVPLGHFLIVAPSPEIDSKTSVGAAFLTDDGVAEKFEKVLLLVPKPYRTDDPDAREDVQAGQK
ncbi:MAG TPA: hypothetical protein VIL86_07810 [Tepidisphaeraceae bacterium]|jgi:hypothetical protein